jgi:hypothetical protein
VEVRLHTYRYRCLSGVTEEEKKFKDIIEEKFSELKQFLNSWVERVSRVKVKLIKNCPDLEKYSYLSLNVKGILETSG